jgi:hypothetical protein
MKSPRRPRGKILVAIGVVLALMLGSYFYLSLNRSSAGTALAFSLSPGRSLRYGLHMTMNGKLAFQQRTVPFTMDLNETIAWKVQSVDPQGVATVDVQINGVSGKVGGISLPAMNGLHSKIRLARDGRILTAGVFAPAGGNSFSQLPGTDQFTPLLPDHPVKPGDTWSKSFDQAFPFGSGALTYSTLNTFERYENVDGVRTAVIRTVMTVPLNLSLDFRKIMAISGQDHLIPRGSNPTVGYNGKVSFTQTAWFDPSKGEMVKGSALGRFDLTMRFRGFPASMGQPQGPLVFAGTMSLKVDRQ